MSETYTGDVSQTANSSCIRLTQSRLQCLLDYNQETGLFTRKKTASSPIGSARVVAGYLAKDGYVYVHVDGKRYFAHRLAFLHVIGTMPLMFVDHINGIKSDNRFANLRDVDASTNMQNLKRPHARSSTGLLGVSLHKKTGKYRAMIHYGGKLRHLGLFHTKEDAHAEYLRVKRLFHPGGML
jgi:hypothetical protein